MFTACLFVNANIVNIKGLFVLQKQTILCDLINTESVTENNVTVINRNKNRGGVVIDYPDKLFITVFFSGGPKNIRS